MWKEKFETFYQEELPLLIKWRTILQEGLIGKENLFEEVNTILAKLYNTSPLSKKTKINICLLPSTKKVSHGWTSKANGQIILLEVSRCPLKELNHTLGVIWHEIIHLYFEKKYFLPLVNKKLLNNNVKNLIKEAAASSLFPAGVLARKFLKIKIKDNLLHKKISPKKTFNILNLTDKYFREQKSFDNDYIRKLSLILKK